jgi:hypothetical protein
MDPRLVETRTKDDTKCVIFTAEDGADVGSSRAVPVCGVLPNPGALSSRAGGTPGAAGWREGQSAAKDPPPDFPRNRACGGFLIGMSVNLRGSSSDEKGGLPAALRKFNALF